MKTIFERNDTNIKEWLALRKKGIGASEIAAICGLSNFGSALSIYADKISDNVEIRDNEKLYWGNVQEPGIIKGILGLNPGKFAFVDHNRQTFQHDRIEFALASPDGFYRFIGGVSMGVLEIKNIDKFAEKKWDEDGVPVGYQMQVQWQMFVCDLDHACLAVLFGGNKHRLFFYDRDQKAIDMMVDCASRFWQGVIDRNPPVPDGSDASRDALKKLYPSEEAETSIELDETFNALAIEKERLDEEIKALEEKRDECKNKIMAEMKTAETAETADYNITWKTQNKKAYAVKKSTTRVLRISEKKGK